MGVTDGTKLINIIYKARGKLEKSSQLCAYKYLCNRLYLLQVCILLWPRYVECSGCDENMLKVS